MSTNRSGAPSDDELTRQLEVPDELTVVTPTSEPTQVVADDVALAQAREDAEAVRREDEARARQLEREERDRRLGTVAPTEAPEMVAKPARLANDRFAGSLGLFLLRIITAVVIGVRGLQIVLDNPGSALTLTDLGLASYANLAAWGLGIGMLVLAVMLIFGFGTRFAGLLVAVLAIAMVIFLRWGDFNIFMEGAEGFAGDFELLLAGAGLLFTFLGSGGWSIDGGMRAARARRKLYDA